MEAKFSPRVKDVISYSREEALRLGHDYIGTEHLLLGIIREGEGVAMQLLKSLGVDVAELRKAVEDYAPATAKKINHLANIPLVKQAEKALKITYLEAKFFKSSVIGTEHLLLAILKDEESAMGGGAGGGKRASSSSTGGDSKSKTPVLDNFGRDLTKMAEDGKLDP